MKKVTILFAICFLSALAKAQYTDSTFYHLVLSATGALNKTTTERAYLLNNTLNFGIQRKSTVLNTNNSWLYGKQNGTLSNNDFISTLNFNLYKTLPHFYYWGLLNYTTSYSLKINHQVQAGLGIAYNIVDKPNININLSDGILYETSNLLANNKYDTYRNSLRLMYRFNFKNLVVFEGSNFAQHAFSDRKDYILRSSNKLDIKLKKWISFTTSLNYNKMSITRSENLNLTYGITIDQFF